MESPQSVGHDWQRAPLWIHRWVCQKCQIVANGWASRPKSGPFFQDHQFKSPLDGLTCEEVQAWKVLNQ